MIVIKVFDTEKPLGRADLQSLLDWIEGEKHELVSIHTAACGCVNSPMEHHFVTVVWREDDGEDEQEIRLSKAE